MSRAVPTRAGLGGLIAWAFYDWANQSYAVVIQTFVFAAYFTKHVAGDPNTGTALWGNTIAAAGLVVAFLAPVLGAFSDRAGRRKPWIGAFTVLACLACAGLWFVAPETESIPVALPLVWLATVSVQLGTVFYNAMLADIVDPEKLGRWSGWGWSTGYAGGIVCLLVVLFAFVGEGAWLKFPRNEAQHVRATFPFVALWLAVFALPLFLITPDREGTGKSWKQAAGEALEQLVDSFRRVRSYENLVRFLIARIFYTDALATIFALGGVYAGGTFGMDERGVLVFGISLTVAAGLGAAAFSWLDDRLGSHRIILFALACLIVLVTAMLIVERLERFWTLGILLGFFVGPAQACSRSYLSRIAPENLRTQMFGLYTLADKATTFSGPLLVGWITYLAGSQRVGMAVIPVFLSIGFLIFLTATDETPSPEDRPPSHRRRNPTSMATRRRSSRQAPHKVS